MPGWPSESGCKGDMRWLTRSRTLGLTVAVLIACVTASGASKRETAARHYKKGSQLYEDLKHVPPLELGIRQYELVAEQLRAVRMADPTSGYCDDALLKLGEVYRQMAERFDDSAHLVKAAEAFRVLAREYPHSKLRAGALDLVASLTKPAEDPVPPPQPAQQRAAAPPSPVQQPAWPRLALSPDSHQPGMVVEPPASPATVSEIRHHSYDDGTRLVLHVSAKKPLVYEWQGAPGPLAIGILESKLSSPALAGRPVIIDDSLIDSAKLEQDQDQRTRLLLNARSSITFDAFWLEGPGRLVIDIRGAGQPRAGRTIEGLLPPQPGTAGGEKLSRIVIDAGHGDRDTGSVGPRGTREKDIVLDIALRLGRLAQDQLGMEVIQTRMTDKLVKLEERPQIANRSGADLMVSIHCNSARNANVRGIETYYLLNNGSKKLATFLQRHLYAGLSKHSPSIRDRGVRRRRFVVLRGAEQPAALVEVAFLTNRHDEALLVKPSFRQEVAELLLKGVKAFADDAGIPTKRRPVLSELVSQD